MAFHFKHTIRACFTGYIVQAIVNNFVPLLFLTLQSQYQIPLSQITLLITINFSLQLLVDFASIFFIDKIGYRLSAVMAHVFAAAGLILLTILPEVMPSPFIGLLIAVVFYAIGGGLLEVLISPIVEACPTQNKEQTMSLLHSFYCWGNVGVIALSTLFFSTMGTQHWKALAVIWALLPVANAFIFCKVPIAPLIAEGEKGLSLKELFRTKIFWIFMLIILCAGASEQAVSQWASTFAEQGLGVGKTVGDLAGPALFAVLMGSARLLYAKFGDKLDLDKMMLISGGLCTVSYLLISLTASPVLGLLGVSLCGFSVGILWPGTFSKASAAIKGGGTAMFAVLALAGDLGCSSGPTFAGMIASQFGDNLKRGILAAVIFPLLLLLSIFVVKRIRSKNGEEPDLQKK